MINAEEFYKRIMAGDLPDPEEIDNVFDVIEMMIDEVGSAHIVLEDLEDALEESQKQTDSAGDIRQVRRMPKKIRDIL